MLLDYLFASIVSYYTLSRYGISWTIETIFRSTNNLILKLRHKIWSNFDQQYHQLQRVLSRWFVSANLKEKMNYLPSHMMVSSDGCTSWTLNPTIKPTITPTTVNSTNKFRRIAPQTIFQHVCSSSKCSLSIVIYWLFTVYPNSSKLLYLFRIKLSWNKLMLVCFVYSSISHEWEQLRIPFFRKTQLIKICCCLQLFEN